MKKENSGNPRKVEELPVMRPREGELDDHGFLNQYWAESDLAVDSFGVVHSFPYKNLVTLLNDDLTRQIETEGIRQRGITSGPTYEFFDNSLLTSNGQRHKRRRTPLARTFAFPLMKALRPVAAATAEALVAPLRNHSSVDILEEVAGPMPARMIADVLGVPEQDIPEFTSLVYSAIRVLGVRSEAVMAEAENDLTRLGEYVSNILDERRRKPTGDFLSEYLETAENSELSDTEIRITIVSLILAGSDTTRASIAMTLSRLLENPSQWAMLVEQPETWKGPAAEEGLRYDPVVGSLGRIATKEFELSGVRIVPGTILAPSLLTAARDAAIFDRPECFDITRQDHPRYASAFGGGAHRCLGEALARIELEETLSAFAKFWPEAKLVGSPPSLRGISGTRGISEMAVDNIPT